MRIALVGVLMVTACGGTQRHAGGGGADFKCGGRRAEYMESGSIMYAEQGVRMKCEGDVPMVEEYYDSDDGKEKKRSAKIGAGAWNKSWEDLENGGWRRLTDCSNPEAGDKDPIFTFEIADEDKTVTFRCQGKQLPFPFDTVLNALDNAKGELPAEGGE